MRSSRRAHAPSAAGRHATADRLALRLNERASSNATSPAAIRSWTPVLVLA